MRRVAVLVLVTVGGALLVGIFAPAATPSARHLASPRPPVRRPLGRAPSRFASCASLVRFGRHYLARTHGIPETPVQPLAGSLGPPTPVAAGTPSPGAPQAISAPSGSVSYSTTNNQEPGVEEPDTVKTDGSTIFAVSGNQLYAVDVAHGAPKLVGTLDLGTTGYGAQLLLQGSHLLVISSAGAGGPVPLGAPGRGVPIPAMMSPYYYAGTTTITRIDVSDPSAMRVMGTGSIDGSFVDARQNGPTARIVISSAPTAIRYPALRTSAAGYLPRWRFHSLITGHHFTASVASCRQVAHPAQFSGLGMVTIFTINLDQGISSATTDALLADAQVVYGSQSSIYLATEKWIDPTTPAARLPGAVSTQIDRFDATSSDKTTFLASGQVPGYLLNQFSLSESGDYLRVASTSAPDYWGGEVPNIASQSYVTVLGTKGDQLVSVGQISGLGSGQKIYSVRFVGDIAYVVTFRQVDPLYTVDLSDPAAPRVAGQLELEGYSSYLHPLGDGLLLGVGQDVGSNNEPSGAQLELFDVSNPASPKLLQKMTLGQGSSSQVQYDHHAFLFWAPTHLAVLPVQIYPVYTGPPPPPEGPSQPPQSSGDQFTGAVGIDVERSGMNEVGRISHPAPNGYAPPITRSLVIGDRLYTLSDEGILSSRLDTLEPESFVSFPAPPQPVGGSGTSGSGSVGPGTQTSTGGG